MTHAAPNYPTSIIWYAYACKRVAEIGRVKPKTAGGVDISLVTASEPWFLMHWIYVCDSTGEVFLSVFLSFPPSLALCLAAAATPLCAFVTVATNSKARQRCSIAVDVKANRAGSPSYTYVWQYMHTHTHTHSYQHFSINPSSYIFIMCAQAHLLVEM